MSEESAQEPADGPLLEGQQRCVWCGWPFRPPKATGRKPQYCRRACRQRAYEARQTRAEVDAALLLHSKGKAPAATPAGRSPRLKGAESPPLF
ncbi:hypothetical protein PUR71_00875 [Streptomyces sp. SP17BM10]|uniref:hypothetical protein n=1 Tax=Streptomyces sp. SP17BM10 TaxID=3002530 RepID=UPI002E793F0A|nr:hypothetical protein [Streptomyces sp. SP17BM10]MEE1781499.1 hypothetical protein [Streptomyces sp. SP17BM10]